MARVCAGARKTKLVEDAGRSQYQTVLASPRTPIQRRYCASAACAGVVEAAAQAMYSGEFSGTRG
jgi:hypothetical protein